MKKYSKSTKGFYDTTIHGDAIPSDAVEVSDDYYNELMAGQASNKRIEADNKGIPRLVDAPPMTPEQAQVKRNAEARAYLSQTDWYVVRFSETGTPIPDDIRANREAARASVVE